MNRLLDRLAAASERLCAPLILAGVVITGLEVVLRYVFGAPTIWAHEATTFAVGVAFLFGGFHAANARRQIAITTLYDALPARWQAVLDLLAASLGLLCYALLAYACYRPALRALTRWETTGTAWNPPIPAVLMPLLFLAALLLAVQSAADLAARLRGPATGRGR